MTTLTITRNVPVTVSPIIPEWPEKIGVHPDELDEKSVACSPYQVHLILTGEHSYGLKRPYKSEPVF